MITQIWVEDTAALFRRTGAQPSPKRLDLCHEAGSVRAHGLVALRCFCGQEISDRSQQSSRIELVVPPSFAKLYAERDPLALVQRLPWVIAFWPFSLGKPTIVQVKALR